MTQLHPPIERRDAAISGRLVEHRVTLHGLGEGVGVGLLLHLEGVETGARHEYELVAQHLAGGAQLAVIAMPLAQQARLAVGAAVTEGREYQRDRSETTEMRHEIVDGA